MLKRNTSPMLTFVVHPVKFVELIYCCEDKVGKAEAVMLLLIVGVVSFAFHISITADPEISETIL